MPTESLLQALDARRSVPSKQLGEPGPDPATLARMLASAVRVPAIDGEMGFRTGHQPVLAVVRHGIIHVTPTSGGTQVEVADGFVSVDSDVVTVVVADVPMEEFLDDAPVVLEPGPAVGQH